MITTLSSVPIFVSDIDRALEFYHGRLGFEIRADRQVDAEFRWVAVVPSQGQTAIQLYGSVPAGSDEAFRREVRERTGIWTGMVFLTDDIEKTYQELQARGVSFDAPPKQEPWGWETWITDPDGNRFALRQPLSR
jgi:predicted enzyme related to lactoylglutathione lyase